MSGITTNEFDYSDYPIQVKERGGLVYIICKTFNIVEHDVSLDLAYSKLISKRKEIAQELNSFGVDISLAHKKILSANRIFTLQKCMYMSVIFMCLGMPIALGGSAYIIAKKSTSVIASTKASIKSQLSSVLNNPGQLVATLNIVADKIDAVTPERREEMLIAIKKIVAFSKPYANELKELSGETHR